MLPQIARGDSNKMWIIPSELTDALKGIGGMLGRGESGGPDGGSDDDELGRPRRRSRTPSTRHQLEDPMQALAEARGLAGKASQEATEHAAPVKRVQPPMPPPADAVPESARAPTPPPVSRPPVPPAHAAEPSPDRRPAHLTRTRTPGYAARSPERAAYLCLGADGRR